MLTLNSCLPNQENSVHHVQQKQCMNTTWPPAAEPAAPSARLTTRVRPDSPQWTAADVPREPTWTRRAIVWPVQAAPAIIKTPLFLPDRRSEKTEPHGKYSDFNNRYRSSSNGKYYCQNIFLQTWRSWNRYIVSESPKRQSIKQLKRSTEI